MNVYTKDLNPKKKHATIVYIHGGGTVKKIDFLIRIENNFTDGQVEMKTFIKLKISLLFKIRL